MKWRYQKISWNIMKSRTEHFFLLISRSMSRTQRLGLHWPGSWGYWQYWRGGEWGLKCDQNLFGMWWSKTVIHICEGVQSSNILSFFFHPDIVEPKYQVISFFLGHHWPPRGLKIAKCLFFGSFQESHFRSDLHVGCHPEKFYIWLLSPNIFGSHFTCG